MQPYRPVEEGPELGVAKPWLEVKPRSGPTCRRARCSRKKMLRSFSAPGDTEGLVVVAVRARRRRSSAPASTPAPPAAPRPVEPPRPARAPSTRREWDRRRRATTQARTRTRAQAQARTRARAQARERGRGRGRGREAQARTRAQGAGADAGAGAERGRGRRRILRRGWGRRQDSRRPCDRQGDRVIRADHRFLAFWAARLLATASPGGPTQGQDCGYGYCDGRKLIRFSPAGPTPR